MQFLGTQVTTTSEKRLQNQAQLEGMDSKTADNNREGRTDDESEVRTRLIEDYMQLLNLFLSTVER